MMKLWMAASSLFLLAGAMAAEPPAPRGRAEVQAVLGQVPRPPEGELRPISVVLVAFQKDHGPNEHDYPLWQQRWQLLLGGSRQASLQAGQLNLYGPAIGDASAHAGAAGVEVSTAWGWPSPAQLERADLIVTHCYVAWDATKLTALEAYLERGGGFVLVHPACIAPSTRIVPALTELLGLAWEPGYTGYRHGPLELRITAPDHPICLGLPESMRFIDEAYWPLRGDREKVVVLATSAEKDRAGQERPEPMFWTYEYGKGRVFGCIPGHYVWTFDDPYMRILLLRGMAWAAGQSPYRFDSLALEGAPLAD